MADMKTRNQVIETLTKLVQNAETSRAQFLTKLNKYPIADIIKWQGHDAAVADELGRAAKEYLSVLPEVSEQEARA